MEEVAKAGVQPKSLILCAIPFHLRRARATFAQQFPDVTTYGSAFSIVESEWLTPYRIARLVGEVERLLKYAIKGDTAPVEIPAEVMEACNFIRQYMASI